MSDRIDPLLDSLPEPYPGYRAGHRYIYSTEDGDSCSCGWRPPHFRTDPDEWAAHVRVERGTAWRGEGGTTYA